MRYYKYIHVFLIDELIFSTDTVEIIRNPNNKFRTEEHLFIFFHERVYNSFESHENMILVTEKKYHRVINYYNNFCDFFILHSLPRPHQCFFIKKNALKKIVWRTWGHDVGYVYYPRRYIKNIVKYLMEKIIFKKIVCSFKAIGIANIVDRIDVRDRFGNQSIYLLPYIKNGDHESLVSIKNQIKYEMGNIPEGKKYINVLIGHSGYDNDNHMEIVSLLKRFESENIVLHFLLSYGDSEYIENVKKYLDLNWHGKINVVEKFMPYKQYVEFISKIDIAIFDGTISYALGNISVLLNIGKTIFLNRNGMIKKAFDLEQIPYFCTDEISEMTFEQFSTPLKYELNIDSEFVSRDYQYHINNWHKLLNALNSD